MGYYVNPKDMTKEQWLGKHGEPSMTPPSWTVSQHGMLPICLVDNMIFTAAGVCYSERELEDFARDDGRAKLWYTAKISDLIAVQALPDDFKL